MCKYLNSFSFHAYDNDCITRKCKSSMSIYIPVFIPLPTSRCGYIVCTCSVLILRACTFCAQAQHGKMPTYKLTYFNFKGRGELMRLIFAVAGKQFTDERIEMQDWPGIKPSAHLRTFLPLVRTFACYSSFKFLILLPLIYS